MKGKKGLRVGSAHAYTVIELPRFTKDRYSGTPHNGHPSTTATLDITAKSPGPD